MREQLEFIFGNVNEWLKYLEGKIGVIIGFDTAVIFALISILSDGITVSPKFDVLIELYLILSILFLGASLMVSLSSLLPTKGSIDNKNIHYFSDLAKFDEDELKNILEKNVDIYERHMREAIIVNAKIADCKQNYASLAIFLTLSAFTTIIGALLIREYKK